MIVMRTNNHSVFRLVIKISHNVMPFYSAIVGLKSKYRFLMWVFTGFVGEFLKIAFLSLGCNSHITKSLGNIIGRYFFFLGTRFTSLETIMVQDHHIIFHCYGCDLGFFTRKNKNGKQ